MENPWILIPLAIAIWLIAVWWGNQFGRYKNRRPGDGKKWKKWW